MPRLSKRLCAGAGCYAASDGVYCPACRVKRGQRADGTRPSSTQRGYDARWQTLRAQVLREEPRCACGKPATEVDHVVSIRRRPDLRLVRSNLRGKCKRCHSRKTCQQDGGFGR